MKVWWAVGLAVSVLLAVGCSKEEIRYSSDLSVGQAGESLPGGSGEAAAGSQGRQDKRLYILHRWKEDDSLSFLAIYYTGKLEHQTQIEEANPELSFSGRLPGGTPIWVPEEIVRPEIRQNLSAVPKAAREEAAPAAPMVRGAVHKAEGEETLSMIAAFYTGNAQNAARLVAYNPGTSPGRVLTPGREIFIPGQLILQDLHSDLVFVERPQPQVEPGPEVSEASLQEEDLKREATSFEQVPPQAKPTYKSVQEEKPRIVERAPVRTAKPKKIKKVRPARRTVPHKPSSKHKR